MREDRVFVTVRFSILLVALLVPLNLRRAAAQSKGEYAALSPACVELAVTAKAQVASGRYAEAEATLSTALAKSPDPVCTGTLLTNMAAIAAVSGRLAEAERFAEGAVNILTKSFAPEDVVLLRPLQILAAARFEQGETAKAKAAFQKIRLIPIDRPEDVAVVHGMAGIFLHSEGKSQEAESEYLAAIHAWEQAGRGELSDAGSDLMALASLYVKERRLDDAQRTLDRAAVIFAHAQDAVPMDRVKLLNVRAALHTRKGEWREAEQDLREAVSLADDDPRLSPVSLGYVLNNYAQVLRKNHRGREAREIEARVAALGSGSARRAVVDVSELLAKPKSAK